MKLLQIIIRTVILIIIALSKNTVNSLCDYKPCRIIGRKHTMCIYPATLDRTAPKCTSKEAKAGLTRSQRQVILNKHNQLRQIVSLGKKQNEPPAANMMKLTWNYEAEVIAQRLANACERNDVVHDKCRLLKSGTYTGQNWAWMTINPKEDSRVSALENLVCQWFDEGKLFKDFGQIDKFTRTKQNGTDFSDYIQLIWAKTSSVGCGYIEENIISNTMRPLMLICNYAEAGIIKDKPIYIKGEPCSRCPEGTRCSKRYPGLCTGEKDEYFDVPGIYYVYSKSDSLYSRNHKISNKTQIALALVALVEFFRVATSVC